MTLPLHFVRYGRVHKCTATATASAYATAATATAAAYATVATATAATAAYAAYAAAYAAYDTASAANAAYDTASAANAAYTAANAATAAYDAAYAAYAAAFIKNMDLSVSKTKFDDEQIAIVQRVCPKWNVAQIKLLMDKELCIYLGFPIEVVGHIDGTDASGVRPHKVIGHIEVSSEWSENESDNR